MINAEVALEKILQSQELTSKFEEALKKNYSIANFSFWKELNLMLETSKKIEEKEFGEKLEKNLEVLYKKYLTDSSIDEISLSLDVKKKWEKAIQSYQMNETNREESLINLLQSAKKEVERIMLIDLSQFLRENNIQLSSNTIEEKTNRIKLTQSNKEIIINPIIENKQKKTESNKKFCKQNSFCKQNF
jgi:hypothetical protein